jgi:hypothetical protein
MPRSLWTAIVSLFGRGDPDSDGEDEGRFVPSPLDSSVRIAHGGSDDTIERELRDVDERARTLEETRRRE